MGGKVVRLGRCDMTILTPQQFERADGTGDWRALNAGADA
jgi:hypothetical protein